MAYSTITLEQDDGIATLTLNRPDRLNAWNNQLGFDVAEACGVVREDPDVRVLVITGAGRAFSAGGDMAWFEEGIEKGEWYGPGLFVTGALEELVGAVSSVPQPLVASINGPAVGAGATLAVLCDLRIASEEAFIQFPFVHLGVVPENGVTYALARLVGLARASDLLLTGRRIGAEEAESIGLVNRIAPASGLAEATRTLAGSLASAAPLAVQMTKKGLHQGLDTDLLTQVRYESAALDVLFRTEDHAEAIEAFREKRPPRFQGR